MHASRPPNWRGSPESFGPPGYNGHDLQIGQTLGMLLVHNERQTRVLERISDKLDGLPKEIAGALPAPAPPPSPPPAPSLSNKEKAQLALAAMIVALALAGKVSIQEAVQLLAKPLGF